MDKNSKTIDIKLPRGWEDLDNSLSLGKKKTRFSFCSHLLANLTQKQLRYLFTLIAQGYSVEEIKTFCLFRWNKITIIHRYGDNGYMCKKGKERFACRATSAAPRHTSNKFGLHSTCTKFVLTALQVAQAVASLDWFK